MKISMGIDVGTTKCAAVLRDAEQKKILDIRSENHQADLNTSPERSEQDPDKILQSVIRIINQMPQELRAQVSSVGVTGQMHSVMGWNKNRVFPLITWQDRRCSSDGKLAEFSRKSGHELHDGYGAASLAWLGQQKENWDHASTIMDYLTCQLCGNETPVTDASNAASWGIFDLKNNQWDFSAAKALGIPERLLPELRSTGETIGCLNTEWSEKLGLPAGIAVVNAIGDNQASVLGTGENHDDELFLTLGTGAQLSVVINEREFQDLEVRGKLEIRPFDGSRKLAVCSALCGGRAFAWIGDIVASILKDLDLPQPEFPQLLDKIDTLSLAAFAQNSSGIQVCPSFLGERNDPELRGMISGLSLNNFSLGGLGAAAAAGILDNLISDFPAQILAKRSVVLGSGNGIRKVRIIQKMIREKFRQRFVLTETKEEACCGAAVLAENRKV